MTHSELAKALKLARSTVTRDVAAGMPLDIRGALEWREEFKDIRGEKTGPKTIEQNNEPRSKSHTPLWVRQEQQEYLLGCQICKLNGGDPKLPTLRRRYEELAAVVLQNHLDLIDAAIQRRLLTCPGFSPDEAFEKYVNALSELADKWQGILDTEAAEG